MNLITISITISIFKTVFQKVSLYVTLALLCFNKLNYFFVTDTSLLILQKQRIKEANKIYYSYEFFVVVAISAVRFVTRFV